MRRPMMCSPWMWGKRLKLHSYFPLCAIRPWHWQSAFLPMLALNMLSPNITQPHKKQLEYQENRFEHHMHIMLPIISLCSFQSAENLFFRISCDSQITEEVFVAIMGKQAVIKTFQLVLQLFLTRVGVDEDKIVWFLTANLPLMQLNVSRAPYTILLCCWVWSAGDLSFRFLVGFYYQSLILENIKIDDLLFISFCHMYFRLRCLL